MDGGEGGRGGAAQLNQSQTASLVAIEGPPSAPSGGSAAVSRAQDPGAATRFPTSIHNLT